jgi:hypothetical protein
MASLRAVLPLWLTVLCLGCAAAPPPAPAAGAEPDPAAAAAILATIDRFFEAMAAGDAEAFAREQTEDGMTYAQRLRDGRWQLARRTHRELIDGIAAGAGRSIAETYWQPTVLVRGPIAVVWAPYRFRIDGADAHFGVDVFQLIEVEGRWLISGVQWTVEPGAGAELAPAAGAEIRPASLRGR